MTQDDLDFLPVKVTHIGPRGRRSFDPVGKRRLIEACLRSGASVSGLALKDGVNANQLRKWIIREQQKLDSRRVSEVPDANTSTTFVPVVEVVDANPVTARRGLTRGRPKAPVRRNSVYPSQRPPLPSRLVAQLPNGVSIELECSGHDSALLKALVDSLKAR